MRGVVVAVERREAGGGLPQDDADSPDVCRLGQLVAARLLGREVDVRADARAPRPGRAGDAEIDHPHAPHNP